MCYKKSRLSFSDKYFFLKLDKISFNLSPESKLKQKNFSELNSGEKALHFCQISKLEQKTAKTGKTYLNLEIRDQTATLPAKMWDGFDDIISQLSSGSVVRISGKVDEYNGQIQIIIDKMRLAAPEDKVTADDFIPKSEYDLDVMISEFNEKVSGIQDTHLKKLLDKLLNPETFEKYIRVPAGKAWHHAYLHGLLEHTLEIIKICELLCEFHPQINKDLLLTGAILHDFGKTEELSSDSTFDYTDKGKLLGHIVIAANKIETNAKEIPGFPEDLKDQVIHLVLSHQGKLEFASPVVPKTLEAIVLYHADELSAKANAYKNAIKAEGNSGNNWTKFLQLAGTALFIPENKEEENQKTTLFD